MEVENDGDSSSSAISDLVNGLNSMVGVPGTYDYIKDPSDSNGNIGTDEIKVALIYKPGIVSPIGNAQADTNAVFNRAPLGQSFSLNENGELLTVIVNHSKSKGCSGSSGANLDQGDGQGCFSYKRKLQSAALLNFVAKLQVSSGDDDILLIGDFNAYEQENPIDTLIVGGLTNLIQDAYSYAFQGQFGSLDHSFSTALLSNQVVVAEKWHINSDEPRIFDYNEENNPPYLYSANPYRSSDHDPLIIGLHLPMCISLTSSNDTTICFGDSVQLFAYSGIGYQWTPSSSLSDNNIFNPIAKPDTSIQYQVIANTNCGIDTSYSTVFIQHCNTGIPNSNYVVLSDFSIYPNPNQGSFNLSYERQNNGKIHIKINNLLGKIVYDNKIESSNGINPVLNKF